MRFRLPASVSVGSLDYAVRHVGLPDDRDGECDHDSCEIRIQDGISGDRLMQVYLHELLHAVSHERGLRLTERQIDQLAFGIASVASHNHWRL